MNCIKSLIYELKKMSRSKIQRILALALSVFILLPNIVYAEDIERISDGPKIFQFNIYSYNVDQYRAYQGDTVGFYFNFEDEEDIPVEKLELIFDGQKAVIENFGLGTYFAEVLLDDINPTIGYCEYQLNYITDSGERKLLSDKPTDGKKIFLSDRTNLVDLAFRDVEITTKLNKEITEDELKSLSYILDNDVTTYSEIDKETTGMSSTIIFDFKEEGINLSRIEVLPRQDDYYTRMAGLDIWASNDGKKWSRIGPSPIGLSKGWQVMNINGDKSYRYIRLQNSKVWYGNLAELRMFERNASNQEEIIPEITDIRFTSNGTERDVAFPGDEITVGFKSNKDTMFYNSIFNVLLGGELPKISKIADNTYEAKITVDENTAQGKVYFSISHVTIAGESIYLADSTADGSSIMVSNKDNMVDLIGGDVDFIDHRGTNSPETIDDINNLIDGDRSTFSHFDSGVDSETPYVIFDFKDKGIILSRIEFLAKQDEENGNIEGLSVFLSKDRNEWTRLMNSAEDMSSWQALLSFDKESYRYLKITSDGGWTGELSELRLFSYVEETEYRREINIGINNIENPVSTSQGDTYWRGDKVYYGNKDGQGLLWRVLKNEGDSLLLFADDIVENLVLYNHAFINSTWETATIRSYLNGYLFTSDDGNKTFDYTYNNFINKYFTEAEAFTMIESYITTADTNNGIDGGNDTVDKMFLLSVEEVMNKEYGFGSNGTRANGLGMTTNVWWWLRTPGTRSPACASTVGSFGEISSEGTNVAYGYKNDKGVRPAFRIDTDSILFTMYDDDKSKFGDFGSLESEVELGEYFNNNLMITIKGTDESLEAAADKTNLIKEEDMIINVNHKPALILSDKAQVSAMLLDEDGNALYYGKVNGDSNAKSSEIHLPKDLELGSYTVKIFAEEINDNNFCDYATHFSDIDITIKKGVAVEDIIGIPDEVTETEEIILEGKVIPYISSYQDISYNIIDAGETAAEINNNVITYENPGVISVMAVVENGELNGKDYVKEFEIKVEMEKEEIPDEEIPDEEIPGEDAPEEDAPVVDEDKPEEDKPGEDSPEVDKPDADEPEMDTPDMDTPETDKPEIEVPDEEQPSEEQPGIDLPEEDKPVEDSKPGEDIPEMDKPNEEQPVIESTEVNKPSYGSSYIVYDNEPVKDETFENLEAEHEEEVEEETEATVSKKSSICQKILGFVLLIILSVTSVTSTAGTAIIKMNLRIHKLKNKDL